jgi:hypothetical protein
MGIKETGKKGVKWIGLSQEWEKWQGTVNRLMNLRFPTDAGNFLIEKLLDDGGLCSMELVILIEVLLMCSQRYYVRQQIQFYPLFLAQILLLDKQNICLVLQIQKWVNNDGVIYN